MIEKIVLPLVLGILGGLLTNFISAMWSQVNEPIRFSLSFIAGVIVAAIVFWVQYTRSSDKSVPNDQKNSSNDSIVSRIEGKGKISIDSVDADLKGDGKHDVASDINSREGDVDISNINVKRK